MEPTDESPSAVPAWFVTFADMMTLLLTFFIMLASMSELKTEKLYQSMAQSMRRKFGSEAELVSLVSDGARGHANLQGLASMGRMRRAKLMRDGNSLDVAGQPARSTHDRQPIASGTIYFSEGVSELTRADRQRLQALAEKLRAGDETIEVRGHTSQQAIPLESPYRDQWDLAYARCRKTMEPLVAKGIDPRRISIGVTPNRAPAAPVAERAQADPDAAAERTGSRVELWIVPQRSANVARSTAPRSR